GATFDPKRKLAISSNGEGTLSIIEEKDANHFVALPDVPTQRGARTIAIDPATGRLFLPGADVAKVEPPEKAGGRPHLVFAPGSMKLLVSQPPECPCADYSPQPFWSFGPGTPMPEPELPCHRLTRRL